MLQPDGKVILLGTAAGFLAIVRYDSRGRPDPAFGDAGFVLLQQASDSVTGARIDQQPDGRLIAVGVANTLRNGDPRFLADEIAQHVTDYSIILRSRMTFSVLRSCPG